MSDPSAGPRGHPGFEDLRRIAHEAARLGAEVVRARFGSAPAGLERKGAGDYVTSADRESEEAILGFLDGETPHIPVVAEEGGGDGVGTFWAVDPLDGTTNFLLGLPIVAVSVAVVEGGRPVAGAVLAPLLGLEFDAARGFGAWSGRPGSDPVRLQVSDRTPDRAVVATAFPFRARERLLPRFEPVLAAVIRRVEDVRRAGAASLDLAWTAAGVFDGYLELNLAVWDVAAGALLVEEAGGVVTDWDGGSGYLGGEVVAGSPATHRLLVEETRRPRSGGDYPGRAAPENTAHQ